MKKKISIALKKMKLNNIDPLFLDVSIDSNLSVAGWLGEAEPEDSINIFNVTFSLYDEVFENKTIIGEAKCYYHSGYEWANERIINLVDTADSLGGDFLDAVVPVTGEDGTLSDDYTGVSILYIDTFYIKPEYRGRGLGQVLFPLIIDVLGREMGVITIIPTPTEDDGGKRLEIEDPRYQPMLTRMIKFIKNFGFEEVDKENRVWAKDPTLKD